MTERANMSDRRETPYAICRDFIRIFDEDVHGLYQLSFLLTGDHEVAERCFVCGLDDCTKEKTVFREWAHGWAKRVIVKNAIRELHPRRIDSSSSNSLQTHAISGKQLAAKDCFSVHDLLKLADFDRFVFVLCVLEKYREYDCALLLESSVSEVREARSLAMAQLVNFHSSGSDRHEDKGLLMSPEVLAS